MHEIQKLIDNLVHTLIKQGEALAEPECRLVEELFSGPAGMNALNVQAYKNKIRRAAVAATLEKHGFILMSDGSIDQSEYVAREFGRWVEERLAGS